MPLYRYATQCLALSDEAKTLLTDDEYEDVFGLLGTLTYIEWMQWRHERRDVLRALADAPPGKQKQKLQKMERSERMLTVFALSQFYAEAAELLEAASELHPGGSYRSTAVRAWDLLQKLEEMEHSYWPWGGPPGYRR